MNRTAPISIHRTRVVARIKQRIVQRALDSVFSEPPTSERTNAARAIQAKWSLPEWAQGVKVETATVNKGKRKQHVLIATERRGH